MVNTQGLRAESQSSAQEITGAREAAILVAAGHVAAAERLLRLLIEGPEGRSDPQPWLMLLEMLRIAGRPEEFAAVGERFRQAHGVDGPAWGVVSRPLPAGTFALRGVLGEASEQLEELRRFALARRTMVLDLGGVERIDYGALFAFQVLVHQIAASGRRMIFANVSELCAVLLQTVGVDRHVVIMRRKGSAAPEADRAELLAA